MKVKVTQEQIDFMALKKHEIDFKLEGIELFALYSLGQMHGKVVKLEDTLFPEPRVGIFSFNHINGDENPNFNKMSDWKKVEIDSISFRLTIVENSEESSTEYESLTQIKSIALLKQ